MFKRSGSSIRPPQKSCLVVLHHPPLLKTRKSFYCTKVYVPNFQHYKTKFFFFENFDVLNIFLKLFLSICFILTCMKRFFSKVDLFGPSFGAKETIIIHVALILIWKKSLKKGRKKICPPAPTPKKLWRTTKQLFFLGQSHLHPCVAAKWCELGKFHF